MKRVHNDIVLGSSSSSVLAHDPVIFRTNIDGPCTWEVFKIFSQNIPAIMAKKKASRHGHLLNTVNKNLSRLNLSSRSFEGKFNLSIFQLKQKCFALVILYMSEADYLIEPAKPDVYYLVLASLWGFKCFNCTVSQCFKFIVITLKTLTHNKCTLAEPRICLQN